MYELKKETVKWGTKTWRHQPLPTSKYCRLLLFQEEPIFLWRWPEGVKPYEIRLADWGEAAATPYNY